MDPATATADSFNTTSPLAAPNRMRARMLISAALALVGCRLLGLWHSVAGMVAACMVMAALAIGVVSISSRLRHGMFYLLLPVAAAANAATLAAGSCLAYMGNQGLLPGGRLGMKVPWTPLFWCVPFAAAISLCAFAKSGSPGFRNRCGAALAANLVTTLFALWYWTIHEAHVYPNGAPPLGAVLLLAVTAMSFATLFWDMPRPTAGATPSHRVALGRASLVTAVAIPTVTMIVVALLPLYRHRQTIAELESLGFGCMPGRVPRWSRNLEDFLPVYGFLAEVDSIWMQNTQSVDTTDAKRIEQLLKRLPALSSLSINDLRPGAGRLLRPLAGRRVLWQLWISGSGANDETLTDIAALPSLTFLKISGPGITDNGLVMLGKLPFLECLELSDAHVSGKGLSVLASLPRLRQLKLTNVPIDDVDISALERCRALVDLDLLGTHVTDRGVARLRQSFPHVRSGNETLDSLTPGAAPALPAPAAPAPTAVLPPSASPAPVESSDPPSPDANGLSKQ